MKYLIYVPLLTQNHLSMYKMCIIYASIINGSIDGSRNASVKILILNYCHSYRENVDTYENFVNQRLLKNM